jgi:hypothetical protein
MIGQARHARCSASQSPLGVLIVCTCLTLPAYASEGLAVVASVNPSQSTQIPATPSAEMAPMASGVSPAQPLSCLDGRDIACRAVRNWLPAQALRARGRTIDEAYAEEDECQRRAAHTLANFLNLQACHQEDIAAANGLRAYYTRIALAEQLQLGNESRSLVSEERGKQQAALQSGLSTGVDLSAFTRQELEIDDLQLQLRSQDRQLRDLLAQLARYHYEMEEVNQEALHVQTSEIDCQALVAFAVSHRYDMRSWLLLNSQVNETSAPIIAKLLSTAVGGFGLPLPIVGGLKSLFCPMDVSKLASNLRRELNLAVETQRRWIEQTVLEKCAQAELAYQRLQLSQQTVSSWQERRSQLQQLRQLGETQPEQTAAAQVGWLQARAVEIRRRLEARLAEIELAEATGELSRRCCAGQAWLMFGQ